MLAQNNLVIIYSLQEFLLVRNPEVSWLSGSDSVFHDCSHWKCCLEPEESFLKWLIPSWKDGSSSHGPLHRDV